MQPKKQVRPSKSTSKQYSAVVTIHFPFIFGTHCYHKQNKHATCSDEEKMSDQTSQLTCIILAHMTIAKCHLPPQLSSSTAQKPKKQKLMGPQPKRLLIHWHIKQTLQKLKIWMHETKSKWISNTIFFITRSNIMIADTVITAAGHLAQTSMKQATSISIKNSKISTC